MDENTTLVESLLGRITGYIKSTIELTKLKAIAKIADIVSTIIPHIIVFIFAATFMLFLNVGIALWLGEILGSSFYGFFVVAGFYVIIAVIAHFVFRKRIKRSMANTIVQQLIN